MDSDERSVVAAVASHDADNLIERDATIMDFGGAIATGGNDECFTKKDTADAPAKRALYWASWPVAFACDIGIVRLHARQRQLERRLRDLPFIAYNEALVSRLGYLSRQDVEDLVGLLDSGWQGPFTFSGHYVFANGEEAALFWRLTTANLAALEMLEAVRRDAGDMRRLAAELNEMLRRVPELFPVGAAYGYCFR